MEKLPPRKTDSPRTSLSRGVSIETGTTPKAGKQRDTAAVPGWPSACDLGFAGISANGTTDESNVQAVKPRQLFGVRMQSSPRGLPNKARLRRRPSLGHDCQREVISVAARVACLKVGSLQRSISSRPQDWPRCSLKRTHLSRHNVFVTVPLRGRSMRSRSDSLLLNRRRFGRNPNRNRRPEDFTWGNVAENWTAVGENHSGLRLLQS